MIKINNNIYLHARQWDKEEGKKRTRGGRPKGKEGSRDPTTGIRTYYCIIHDIFPLQVPPNRDFLLESEGLRQWVGGGQREGEG